MEDNLSALPGESTYRGGGTNDGLTSFGSITIENVAGGAGHNPVPPAAFVYARRAQRSLADRDRGLALRSANDGRIGSSEMVS